MISPSRLVSFPHKETSSPGCVLLIMSFPHTGAGDAGICDDGIQPSSTFPPGSSSSLGSKFHTRQRDYRTLLASAQLATVQSYRASRSVSQSLKMISMMFMHPFTQSYRPPLTLICMNRSKHSQTSLCPGRHPRNRPPSPQGTQNFSSHIYPKSYLFPSTSPRT